MQKSLKMSASDRTRDIFYVENIFWKFVFHGKEALSDILAPLWRKFCLMISYGSSVAPMMKNLNLDEISEC